MGEEQNTCVNKSQIVSESSCQEEELQLIPGLPDEIAMECLIRVPYQFHSNMKSVCHSWQKFISHPFFYQQRLKSGSSERLVCLVQPLPQLDSTDSLTTASATATAAAVTSKEEKQIQSSPQFALCIYNATHDIWQRTRPQGGIPMFCQCLALPSSGKVLLLGGWDPTTLEPVPDVYIVDLTGADGCRWRRGASMSVSRSFFACALVGPSKVFVAGGHDSQKNALRSAEVYDVDKNEWRKLPDMIEERDECQGLAWDGDSRFWVVSGYGTETQGQFRSDAEFYDPDTESWSKVDAFWPFSSTSPRGATAMVSINRNQFQRWWFFGGEQQQLHQQRRICGEMKGTENMRWEIVNSILLPERITGTNPCMISLGDDEDKVNNNNNHSVFVMSGSVRRSSSSSSSKSCSCNECDYEGAFILESDCSNGTTKWNHIHTPAGFSGFPFSVCYVTI